MDLALEASPDVCFETVHSVGADPAEAVANAIAAAGVPVVHLAQRTVVDSHDPVTHQPKRAVVTGPDETRTVQSPRECGEASESVVKRHEAARVRRAQEQLLRQRASHS